MHIVAEINSLKASRNSEMLNNNNNNKNDRPTKGLGHGRLQEQGQLGVAEVGFLPLRQGLDAPTEGGERQVDGVPLFQHLPRRSKAIAAGCQGSWCRWCPVFDQVSFVDGLGTLRAAAMLKTREAWMRLVGSRL